MSQRHRHPADDQAAVEQRFADGLVVDSNADALRFDDPLNPGQDVWFYRRPAPEKPVPYDIELLYEDERLLVVDKPPFLATMPRAQHITETATVRLRRLTGNNDLTPAHRLDRLTSGVLVFTKYREVRGAYQTLFAKREVTKVYEAIAPFSQSLAGDCPVTWHNRIHKEPGQYQATLVDGEPNALTVLSSVTPLDRSEQARFEAGHGPQPELARYELHPTTGKTHQLRLHMWAAGAPILGDGAYPVPIPGEDEDFSKPLRLVARSLSFIDPVDGYRRFFQTSRR